MKTHKAWRSSQCYSHQLAGIKAASYWKVEIGAASGNSCHIWRYIVDNFLGEKISCESPRFSAEEYHDMLNKKVAEIRAAMASAVDQPTLIIMLQSCIILNQ